MREAPVGRMDALVPSLIDNLLPYLITPFAFFGHSLGALVAFELTRALRRAQLPLPEHLFMSGQRAPHLRARGPELHGLPDQDFQEQVFRLNGTSADIMADKELIALLLPALRSDFTLAETYNFVPEEPLQTRISVFGGADDPENSREELEAWNLHTHRFQGALLYPGDHFFLNQHGPAILDFIKRDVLKPRTD